MGEKERDKNMVSTAASAAGGPFASINVKAKKKQVTSTSKATAAGEGKCDKYECERHFVDCLPPENAQGNIEYKSQLVNPSSMRVQHLSTQMKWRLSEGNGEAIYQIGVNDDGSISGLTRDQLQASLRTIQNMASFINAAVATVEERVIYGDGDESPKYSVKLIIRKLPDAKYTTNLRLAVIGSGQSGKSTLCGVLTQGKLDNGMGQTRISIFRHLHEFRSGRTSSICLDLIGFSKNGQLLNYKEHSLEELLQQSQKLITLIDLAGDRKFLKTTIYGVSGYTPHYCALLIGARSGITMVTKEHFGIAIALSIPLFVIVTKIDLVTNLQLERIFKSLNQLVEGADSNRLLRMINSKQEVESCIAQMPSLTIVPVFNISNVTGLNLDLLTLFLAHLPHMGLPLMRNLGSSSANMAKYNPLFYIEEIFRSERIGVIVCGLLAEGILYEGNRVKIGPGKSGYFTASINSIHQNKQPVLKIKAGDAASISLASASAQELDNIRRGMVLVDAKIEGQSCWRFTAQFCLLSHPLDQICVGFQGTVYIGSLRRTVTILDFDATAINKQNWMNVTFKFQQQPEYVRIGMPFIFRERLTKAMGMIIEAFD